MAVTLSSLAGAAAQFFDNNGVPLAGGLIYTYTAGTTTPATTYTSSTGLIAHANPIVLDSAGRIATGEVWLTSGVEYKFVIKTSVFVQLGSYDNIPSINDFTTIYAALANTSNVALGDALIGFRQSNSAGNLSNSVGRTVHQKLQESVSVQDFGAVGDGVADDTAAVQAAMNASNNVFTNNGLIFKCTSPITITNKSIKIEGGSFLFTSNDGFIYTANDESQSFQINNVVVYAGVEATGAAISASWAAPGSNYQSCNFQNVSIRGNTASDAWDVGIEITNGHNNNISNLQIVNAAAMAKMSKAVHINGTGVTTIIQNAYIQNAMVGVLFENGTYDSKVVDSRIVYCDTCIDFNYTTAQYGAILNVKDSVLYPISYGVKGLNVIAVAIENVVFQKEVAGTWYGVHLTQTGVEIFESIITNCQFASNLGTGPWVGIYATGSSTLIIKDNIFDSSSGTCISLDSTVSNSIIVNNTNAQLISFIANNNSNNIINDNFQLYQRLIPISEDVATVNPPNVKNFTGNSQGEYFEIGNNVGTPISVSGLTGGVYWQHLHLRVIGEKITLVHNNLVSGSKFDLKGGINFLAPGGAILSFIAVPDGLGNIIWREYSPRNMYLGITGSVANSASTNILTGAQVKGFYQVFVNGQTNTTTYASSLIYFDSAGTANITAIAATGMSISSAAPGYITITNSSGGSQAFDWSIVRQN